MNLNVPVGGEESTDEPEQSFAEDRGSDTWDILYQLFLRTDDRLIHQHVGRKNQQRRCNCAGMLVCLFSSDRDSGIQALQ